MKNKIKVYGVMFVVGIFLSSYLIVFATGMIIKNKNLSFQNDDTHSQSETTIINSKSSSDESKNLNNNSEDSQHEIPSESRYDDENKNSETTSKQEVTSKEPIQESQGSDNNSWVEESSSVLDPSMFVDDSSDSQDVSYVTSELVSDNNVDHDDKLIFSLSSAGFSTEDLEQLNCQQIITVTSNGNTAEIRFYYLNENGMWENDPALTTDGYVGSQGVSKESYEGSYETPFGLYGIGDAFYIDTVPETSLNTFQITQDTYWVDDPDSVFYNQRVEGTEHMDWNSAEHMMDYYNSYRFGFVIEYNTENTIPGKGSAFFFHISWQPTAGCVGASETMVLKYLKQLNKDCNPHILMQ